MIHLLVATAASAAALQPLRVVAPAAARRGGAPRCSAFVPGETCTGEKVVVVGATGYIGKAVVRESVARGYPTVAVVRDAARAQSEPKFSGATVAQADVCDAASLGKPGAPFEPGSVDVVVSCLASRSGSKKDSFAVDYQATLNCLNAARAAGARHFVMLSAFCVKSAEEKQPYALQFQYAKKDMEAALREQSDMSYSIVRPTAFFKSVSGQVEVVKSGGPFVYFDLGNGKSATCNPISEPDLAAALVDTIGDESKAGAVWNLGGPDDGLSMQEQGRLVGEALGKDPEEVNLLGVPIAVFNVIIDGLQGVGDGLRWLSEREQARPEHRRDIRRDGRRSASACRRCARRSSRGICSSAARRTWTTPPSSAGSAGTTRSRTCSRRRPPTSTARRRWRSTTRAWRWRGRILTRTRPYSAGSDME